MTIKEFFESSEKLAIHCDTEEKANKLLKAFDEAGYRWSDGVKYTDAVSWRHYQGETCYDTEHELADREYYRTHNYEIIEFEDIELGDTIKTMEYQDVEGRIKFEPDLSQYTTDELLQEIKRRGGIKIE